MEEDRNLSPLPNRPLTPPCPASIELNLNLSSCDNLEDKLKILLDDGRGECIYHFGPDGKSEDAVEPSLDELNAAENVLRQTAAKLGADVTILRRRPDNGVDVLVRKIADAKDFIEVR